MPQDHNRVFVTGGTGLLGNCIVRELAARNIATRVLCRKGTSTEAFDGLDVDIVFGDLASPELLSEYTQGCNAVIHSAAMIHIGWHKLDTSRKVNVDGTRHIIDACLTNYAKLIHVSTVDTLPAALDYKRPIDEGALDGTPKTACSYVVSKQEAEQEVRHAIKSRKLDATIVNPGFMLGPFDWKPSSGRMMLEVNKAPIIAAPPGGCSFCDARDVATAIVNAIDLGRCGESYIVAGENLRYQELWQMMLKATGRQRTVYRLGPAVKLAGSVIDAANRWLPIKEGDVNGAAIAMGSLNHFYDSSKAEKELNYARRPAEETLRDAWEWLSTRFG